MSSRWIRLDTGWSSSGWIAALPPESRLCWPELLCYAKAHGIAGRVKALAPPVAARLWSVTRDAVTTLVTAAKEDGALLEEDGEWVITGWGTYQGDPTAPDRSRRYRQRQHNDGPEPPPETVTPVTRDVTPVTTTVTVTETMTETEESKNTRTTGRDNGGQPYPPEFEAAWRLYPRREGGNPKKAALKAWAARMREGIPPGDLLEATRRYRAYCDAKLTTGSPYVMQGETFYGPHERWAEKFQADGLGEANRKLLRSASKLDGLDLEESFR